MLPEYCAVIGAVIGSLGGFYYLFETIVGKARPNRITWLLWGIFPMVIFVAQRAQGVAGISWASFVSGFTPLLIVAASFFNKKAYWKSEPRDYQLMAAAIIGIILWGVFAVVHYLVLKSPLDITFGASSLGWIQAADGDGNLTSIFQYGSMGAYLVVLVSMFFSHYMFFNYKRLSWWEWPVYTAAIVLTVLIALLISGRGALILLGAFWFIMILFSRRWILFAGVIILGAIFFIVPNPKFRDSLQYITNPSQIPNMGGRLEQYNAAWTILNDGNEAYGVGLGNFHYHFQKRYPIQYENSPVQFVHNGYLSILVETGFAGFAVYMFYFIAFLIYAYRRSIRNIKSSILGEIGRASCRERV